MQKSCKNKHCLTYYWSLLFSILFSVIHSLPAFSQITEISDANGNTSIHLSSQVFLDTDKTLSINEIIRPEFQAKFTEVANNMPSFGLTDASVWIKFTYNDTRTTRQNNPLLLEVAYPALDYVDVYRPSEEGYQRYPSGALKGADFREIEHRNFLFYLPESINQPTTVYLKIRSETPIIVPLHLKTYQYILGADKFEAYLLVALLSGFATLFLYNLSLCINLREKSLFYYEIFLLGMMLPMGFLTGILQSATSISSTWIATEFWAYVSLISISYTLFISEMLELKTLWPRSILMGRALILWFSVIALVVLVSEYRLWFLGIMSIIPLCVFILSMLFYCSKIKQRAAHIAILAWIPSAAAAFIWAIASLGIIPMTWWVLNGVFFGSAASSILLSISISDKVNHSKKRMYLLEKSTRLELEEANEALQKSNQVKEAFLSTISHELRTPLNGIVGSLSLVEDINDELVNKESSEENLNLSYHVEQAGYSASEMLSLVNNIIDFTEIRGGRTHLTPEYFPPYSSLINALEKREATIRSKKLALKMNFDALSTLEIYSDKILFEKVFNILIENAIKFTHKGTITITAHFEKVANADANLVIQIIDTGIGIPEESRSDIVQPFSQADQSRKRAFGGLGIGLSLCKKMVDLLGGDIEFRANDEQGTVVELHFNIHQFRTITDLSLQSNKISAGDPQKIDPAPSSTPAANDASAAPCNDSNNEFILIVEDNKTNQVVAQAIVRKLGMIPVLAEDGSIALEIIQHQKIDYILMDCQMPVMDGFEATRHIRALEGPKAKLPIIAVTANCSASDKRECRECGMDDFIAKPITLKVLTDKISTWNQQHKKTAN